MRRQEFIGVVGGVVARPLTEDAVAGPYPSPCTLSSPRDAATEPDAKRQEIRIEAVSGCRRLAALVDTDTTALNELRSVQDGTCLSNVETTTREPEEVLRKISIRAG
jgi:hypothetical protein